MDSSTAVTVRQSRDTRELAAPAPSQPMSIFSDFATFENGQRMARALTSSSMVPTAYRGDSNMGNALIALDVASRMRISPIMVMQNLHIIEGRPSWSSEFIIGALNSCGLFSPLRFAITDEGEKEVSYEKWEGPKGSARKVQAKSKVRNLKCRATAIEKGTGEILEGPEVSVAMAVAEGWYFRGGSKWPTMTELMVRYRAAAFFGRLYAPHILNGMPTSEEVREIEADYVDVTDRGAPAQAPAEPARRGSRLKEAVAKVVEASPEPETPAEPKPRSGKPKAPEPQASAGDDNRREDDGDDDGQEHDDAPQNEGDDRDDVFGEPGEDDDEYSPA